jgi:hypothetical protein
MTIARHFNAVSSAAPAQVPPGRLNSISKNTVHRIRCAVFSPCHVRTARRPRLIPAAVCASPLRPALWGWQSSSPGLADAIGLMGSPFYIYGLI